YWHNRFQKRKKTSGAVIACIATCLFPFLHIFLLMLRSWYVVWQLFLSKFKFLRELIGDTGSQQGDNELPETEVDQETPPSPHRGRQKSARQRRAPAEETT
uniref:Small integral membrane protein 13 n=1 Tax=Nothoprocta perdicaria TaxID=30464 RepID=A0A8C6ZIR5_NOTPE